MIKTLSVAIALMIAWKCVSVNWIVVAPFVCHVSDPLPITVHETRYFTPESSPLWRPPIPIDYDESARSWSHFTFFYSGGAGGPTEEPYLRIHWTRMTAESFGMLLFTSLGIMVVARGRRRKRPNKMEQENEESH